MFTTRNVYSLDSRHFTAPIRTGSVQHFRDLPTILLGQQARGPRGSVDLTVEPDAGGVRILVRAHHEEPVKSVKLLLSGLPEAGPDGGWWHALTPEGEHENPAVGQPLRWVYPGPEWVTRWACIGKPGRAITLSVRDSVVRPARLWVNRPPYLSGRSVTELILEEDAGAWTQDFEAPPVLIRSHASQDDVDADFAAHLDSVAEAFSIPAFETRSDLPSWFQDIRVVVNLHGEHWTGYVFNTFAAMEQVLETIAARVDGRHVLAYLPGWEGRYYYAYPYYESAPELGGPEGFASLCETARRLGIHLMPMFGANGVNAELYPGWEPAAFRNRTDRYVRLVNAPDWDGDRSGEDNQLFCSPADDGFRAHLKEQILGLVSRFPIDSVLLDTSACYFNDPRHNFHAGYQALVGEIHAERPDLLVAGEGWWDALLGVFPVNQSWVGVRRTFRYPEVLTRFGRALGHLSSPAPGMGSTGVHEGGFLPPEQGAPSRPGAVAPVAPGHLPAISIVEDTLREHRDELLCLIDDLADPALTPASNNHCRTSVSGPGPVAAGMGQRPPSQDQER